MSDLTRLLRQSSHYFAGHILLAASGLISFPILTRVFSIEEYGLLGLINTTFFLVGAITKLGLPSSIVRFHAEAEKAGRLPHLYSTAILTSTITAAAAATLFILPVQFSHWLDLGEDTKRVLSIVAVLVFISCMVDILSTFMRAEQRTRLYNLLCVVRRYGALCLSICIIVTVGNGLRGFFLGQVIANAIVMIGLFLALRQGPEVSVAYYSKGTLKQYFMFGFPLLWAELGHLLLNYADRYIVQLYLGTESLGLYTAGYNLATHVTEAIIYPLSYAMSPIYMDILVKRGDEETRRFLTKLFSLFVLVITPMVFGFISIGEDLFTLLASQKFNHAHPVLPYVVLGQALYASTIILNCGIFISKKTYIITYTMFGVCVLNIGLNILMVPRNGILGAAWTTFLSYLVYSAVLIFLSMRQFSFPVNFRRIGNSLCATFAMLVLVVNIDLRSPLYNIIARVSLGAIVYALAIMALDVDLRQIVSTALKTATLRGNRGLSGD